MITIVKPDYTILTSLDGIVEHIERCGRVCYKSEDRITEGSTGKFVRNICRNRHESVLEHANITVIVKCSRACSHQIVRHRLCSFSQESQRYVKVINPALIIDSKDAIVSAYLKGLPCRRISELSKGVFTEWQVYNVLRQFDIKRRPFGNRGLVYHDFFHQIDTPEKAYLLGIILADGNVSRESAINITQHQDIIWYLHKMVREFIQPEIKLHRDNGNCQRLAIHSKQCVKDLYQHGIVPNKTMNMTEQDSNRLWSSVPSDFIPDFLRGFLDGDGSAIFNVQNNPGQTQRHMLQWIGHAHTLVLIKRWCKNTYGYSRASVNKVSGANLYRYQVSNPAIIEKLCKDLFKNFRYPFGNPLKASAILQQYNLELPVFSSKNGMEVILPPSLLKTPSLWTWYKAMEIAAEGYSDLLLAGCKPEDARFVLPNATKTELAITANLRQWRHVFRVRCDKHAQWEIRSIFEGLLDEFRLMMPDVFGDLGD